MTAGFVVDASVAMAWVHPAQATEETQALLEALESGALIAVPAIWPLEVANALRVLTRRKGLSEAERLRALAALQAIAPKVDAESVALALTKLSKLYHGTLAGLAERAIRWHRQVNERRRLEQLVGSLGGPDRPTARPPIPLPAVPGVTFLSSVGEVAEEGARMQHCIATRAPDAIEGRCFLFHVEYRGERASVEVSAAGKIADAEGPRNTHNAAVRWGFTQLRAWGAGLCPRNAVEPPRTIQKARHAVNPNQLALPF